MKSAAELSSARFTQVAVELVHGTQDGTRDLVDREDDGKPPERQVHGTETYVRREASERCRVDGLLVWHYDLDRNSTAGAA